MDKKDVLKVGIAGYGFVGRVVAEWFKPDNPIIFDKYLGRQANINEADIVFVCVPTPYNNGFDDSEVIDVLSRLKRKQTVVIKSTVIPGSTDKYQRRFPELKILFNPEFLVEKTAMENFIHPDRQIIGYTKKSKDVARNIIEILPPALLEIVCGAREAEMAKYVNNAFLATKLIFFEEIYDICRGKKIDYKMVRQIVAGDQRIGMSHTGIGMDGKRGFDGKCLPKDLSALIDFAKRASLLKTIKKLNERYNG